MVILVFQIYPCQNHADFKELLLVHDTVLFYKTFPDMAIK